MGGISLIQEMSSFLLHMADPLAVSTGPSVFRTIGPVITAAMAGLCLHVILILYACQMV